MKEPNFDVARMKRAISLTSQLKKVGDEVADQVKQYAPPAVRNSVTDDLAVQVKSFAELPTQELDTLVEAAEAKVAQLKVECQQVRDVYTAHTTRIAEALKQIQLDVDRGILAVKELQEQLRAAPDTPQDIA